jgi:tetratricopeptide (TPR) repeat protein
MTQNDELKILDQAPASPPSPEWIAAVKAVVDKINPKDCEQAVKDMEAFFQGDAPWAQVQGIPKKMLFDIAEQAYIKFKGGRLEEAKVMFRGLCLVDHTVAYFHTGLGAIYQKERQYFDALAEYTVAIELDPEDITAYVNRGETYYLMGLWEKPLEDLDKAIALDPKGKDPWANRARFLKKKIEGELAALNK